MRAKEVCFACGRLIYREMFRVCTSDGQRPFVGADCYLKVVRAKDAGFQPSAGGPRMWADGAERRGES